MQDFHALIEEICEELKIKMTCLSKDWIVMLEKENKIRYIAGYKFDLNGHALGSIMDDKYAMYEILIQKKIPVIEHTIAFRSNNQNDYAKGCNRYEFIENFFNQHGQNIVIKANDSTCGVAVYHITNVDELRSSLDRLFKNHFSISLCPFYDIKREYRLIFLKNECVLLYGKKRPIVTGDGKKTIRELLEEFNPNFFQGNLEDSKYDYVLKYNEMFEYSWKFNLSEGAIPIEITDEKLKQKLQNFGEKVSTKMNLPFCSLDVIELMDGKLLVMEINSGVMMFNYAKYTKAGRDKTKEIYKRAIEEMFS